MRLCTASFANNSRHVKTNHSLLIHKEFPTAYILKHPRGIKGMYCETFLSVYSIRVQNVFFEKNAVYLSAFLINFLSISQWMFSTDCCVRAC